MRHLEAFLSLIERPAYWIDIYRVIPRLVLIGCGIAAWHVSDWFMALTDPSAAQATFVSVVYGTIPLTLNFYMQNGVNWDARRQATVSGPVSATATVETK